MARAILPVPNCHASPRTLSRAIPSLARRIACHGVNPLPCQCAACFTCIPAAETGVRRPDNIAALAGSSVVFRCTSSANNQTRWDYYRHGVNQPTTIFNGERIDWRVSSRFTVDAESCMRRQCDLTIRRVQPSDAGYFVCFEPSKSNRRSAALVVLGNCVTVITSNV